MADSRRLEVHRSLRGLFNVGTVAGLSDGDLLDRFITRRGESAEMAFAALVERHGAMVLRVCRKVLPDTADAADAFQATFLVLAGKAGSIRRRDSLGAYIHGVALRVAYCARSAESRRRKHERRFAEMTRTSYVERPQDDLVRIIHEELGRLPERFRGVAVLCDLEGKTYVEAAGLLGCPPGTVMSRLAEARRRLRGRLARRGLAPSIGVLSAMLATETRAAGKALPVPLAEITIQAATRFAAGTAANVTVGSASVIALTEGVFKAMFVTKLKSIAMLSLVGGVVATGAGVLAQAPATPEGTGSPRSTIPAASMPGADPSRVATPEPTDDRFQALENKLDRLLNVLEAGGRSFQASPDAASKKAAGAARAKAATRETQKSRSSEAREGFGMMGMSAGSGPITGKRERGEPADEFRGNPAGVNPRASQPARGTRSRPTGGWPG